MPVTEFAVFLPQECEKVVAKVYELKNFWIRQHPTLLCYTKQPCPSLSNGWQMMQA